MRRTIYLVVEQKRTGKRLGVAALKRVAGDVGRQLPRGAIDLYHGDYIAGGTRFGVLEADDQHVAAPVLKVRGNDWLREMVVQLVAREHRIAAIAGHDRKLIGGRR